MSVAAIFFGYSMVAATSWLNGSHPYRMPGRRLAAYVAMEILDLLLVSISVGLFIVFAISLASGRPAFPWLWLSSSAAGLALTGLAVRVRKKFGKAWRDELLSGPEGANPVY
jgi:hypothetical protein